MDDDIRNRFDEECGAGYPCPRCGAKAVRSMTDIEVRFSQCAAINGLDGEDEEAASAHILCANCGAEWKAVGDLYRDEREVIAKRLAAHNAAVESLKSGVRP